MVKRFGDKGEAFHFSMLAGYVSYCCRSTWFSYVEKLIPEHRRIRMWAGNVLHKCIEIIHKENLLDADEVALTELITDCMRWGEYECEGPHKHYNDYDVPILWDDKEQQKENFQTEALTILTNYCTAPWNRQCKVLLNEAKFNLVLETAKTSYKVEGRIDALVEYPGGKLEVRDYKYSKMAVPSNTQLLRDIQLNGYPIAIEKGWFINEEGMEYNIGNLPDITTFYNLRDHLEYSKPQPVIPVTYDNLKKSTSYVDWFVNEAKTYSLDEIRELTGNNKLNAKNKVYFNTGHQKGPGRHTIDMTPHRARALERDIKNTCAAIRLNMYPMDKRECNSCRHEFNCTNFLDGRDPKYNEEIDESLAIQTTA